MSKQTQAALEQVQNLKGELNSCAVAVNELELQLSEATTQDDQQIEFTGEVKDYRLVAGSAGETPRHIFELDCGGGLVLHVEVESAQMEQVLVNVDMGSLTGDPQINGKRLKVRRDPSLALLLPVEFIGDNGDGPGKPLAESGSPVLDADGNELRENQRVSIPDYGYTGKVLRYDPASGYLFVNVDEEPDVPETEYTPDQVLVADTAVPTAEDEPF